MLKDTLEILRCPYCGGRLELVESLHPPGQRRSDRRRHPRLPLLHLPRRVRHPGPAPAAGGRRGARAHRGGAAGAGAARHGRGERSGAGGELRSGRPRRPHATYRELVEALGPNFEGGYFLYRFSDPTFIVADAVVRAVGRAVLAGHAGAPRHLWRLGASDPIARRTLVAAARPGGLVLPQDVAGPALHGAGLRGRLLRRQRAAAVRPRSVRARDVLGRFQYIWTKRQFIDEMARVVDPRDGAVLISHTHNQLAWSPSHGQPLSPGGLPGPVRDDRAADFRRGRLVRGRRVRRTHWT